MKRAHYTLLAALTAALAFAAAPAWACGGLFCDGSNPVNQTAERILFIDHGDDSVTAVVEILYTGPSESFSWLVPVPGVPEVGVSSSHVLDRLQQLTNPTYNLRTRFEGNCSDFNNGGANNGATNNGDPDNGEAHNPGGGVSVIASGAVGPYDYQVIQVDPELPDPTGAAVAWLTENGYDVAGPEILGEYLEAGMNLLGFKLNKTATTGSIRPVTMTYQTQRPMIPIKLTAVAANDDMGVLVWVFGEWRAIPTNYRHLVLNEAAINWFNPNANYDDVVNLAADQSGGQGFVTEASLPSSAVSDQLIFSWEEERRQVLTQGGAVSDENFFIADTTEIFGSWDGFTDVVAATIPLQEGVSAEEFVSCPWCYLDSQEPDIEGFDPDEFRLMLRDLVLDPAFTTRDLTHSRPTMTRFYTTLSPREMSLDPEFDFNSSLPEVSNQHQGTRYVICGEQQFNSFDAPWRAELPGGQIVYGMGQNNWPYATDDLPANQIIQQLSVTGMGEEVLNNTDAIDQRLASDGTRIVGELPEDMADMMMPNRPIDLNTATNDANADSGGCATAPTRRAPALLPLSLLAALALLARRSR